MLLFVKLIQEGQPVRQPIATRTFRIATSAVVFACSLSAVPAHGEEADLGIEVTPIGGYRFGGTFEFDESDASYEIEESSSFGLIVNLPHDTNTQWEFLYAQQSSDAELKDGTTEQPVIDVEQQTLQIGGTYQWPGEKLRPYLAATIGGTRIATRTDSDSFFSGSIGLGVLISPSTRLGVRLEARAHGALLRSDTDLLCRTGPDLNICAVRIEGDMLTQIGTFAGFVFRF